MAIRGREEEAQQEVDGDVVAGFGPWQSVRVGNRTSAGRTRILEMSWWAAGSMGRLAAHLHQLLLPTAAPLFWSSHARGQRPRARDVWRGSRRPAARGSFHGRKEAKRKSLTTYCLVLLLWPTAVCSWYFPWPQPDWAVFTRVKMESVAIPKDRAEASVTQQCYLYDLSMSEEDIALHDALVGRPQSCQMTRASGKLDLPLPSTHPITISQATSVPAASPQPDHPVQYCTGYVDWTTAPSS